MGQVPTLLLSSKVQQYNKQDHTYTLRMRALHLNPFNKFLTQKLQKLIVAICWVRINQKVGHETSEPGYEMSEPGYKMTGYPENILDTQKWKDCKVSGR